MVWKGNNTFHQLNVMGAFIYQSVIWFKWTSFDVTTYLAFNPFHTTDLFLYPLKASENLWFSNFFRGYRMRPAAWNGLIGQYKTLTLQSIISVAVVRCFIKNGCETFRKIQCEATTMKVMLRIFSPTNGWFCLCHDHMKYTISEIQSVPKY